MANYEKPYKDYARQKVVYSTYNVLKCSGGIYIFIHHQIAEMT
jgi:hypothetical protein